MMRKISPWCTFTRRDQPFLRGRQEARSVHAASDGAHSFLPAMCSLPQQANATLTGPIMVFLVPVGVGSAANPPPPLPPLPGLPTTASTGTSGSATGNYGLAGGQPLLAGDVLPPGLPELRPPANGDGEQQESARAQRSFAGRDPGASCRLAAHSHCQPLPVRLPQHIAVSYSGSFGAEDLGGPAQGLPMSELVAMFRVSPAQPWA